MRNRALLSALAVCLAVGACTKTEEAPKPKPPAPPPPKAQLDAVGTTSSNPCKDPTCPVAITVSSCTQQSNDIKAVPDPLYAGQGNTAIRWTINGGTGNFAFVANGIDFKDPPGKNNFKNPKPGTTDWTFDNGGAPGTYPYAIALKGPDGTCRVDPTIVN